MMTRAGALTRYLLAALLISASSAAAADLPSALVDPYLRIHTALAGDRMDGVKLNAATVTAQAAKLGTGAASIEAASKKLEMAADLPAARTAFGELSQAMLAYANGTKSSLGPDVHELYCPMVQKSWLQKGKATQNPYYGKAMLTCGELKR